MKKQLFASIAVASTIGFFTPLTSYAFGLGEIKVNSALNEPFKASIDINALPEEEKESFEIRIASNDEFVKAGLERSYILTQLTFDVVEQQGKSKVLIRSQQPIKEPFLDFLLTATAGGGKLIREYTVLLDPPEVLMRPQTANQSSSVTPVEQTPTTVSSQSNTLWSDNQTYGPVARADTLWNIALTTRPDESVSVQQMMLALVAANPEAFVDSNINGLKAGYTLNIPDRAAILSQSQAEAYKTFKAQNKAWRQRNTPVSTPIPTASPAVVQQPQTASTDTEQTVTENSSVDDTENADAVDSETDKQAHLKLVAPEQAKTTQEDASPNLAGNEKINALTEQLTLAQETIEAQAQENIDFKARMDAMEEQLETMRRLISLKDADLARLQDMLEDKEQNNTSTDDASTVSDTDSASEDIADNDVVDEPDATDVTSIQEEANTATTDVNNEESVPTDLADKIKQFLAEYKLQVGGALLLILLLLLLLARRKNNDEESLIDDDTDAESLIPIEDVHAATADDSQEIASQVSPVSDDVESEPVNQEAPAQKSVMELVEQADMFVGYADYAQAKVALEQAQTKEPENTLVAYKMLFVLYKQKQVQDFISLAENTAFDEDSIEWEEIKQWGAQLAPDHALFTVEESVDTDSEMDEHEHLSAESDDEADDNQLDFSPQHEVHDDSIAVDLSDDNNDTPLEFDTVDISSQIDKAGDEEYVSDVHTSSEESLSALDDEKDGNHIDDDLLSFDTGTTFGTVEREDKEDESVVEHDSLLPFEPGASSSLDPERVEIAPFDTHADDEPDIEFDIGDIDEIDEAETKLDLATAYIDMEDPEGAVSILNEVLVEGNDEQKARAQTILDSIPE